MGVDTRPILFALGLAVALSASATDQSPFLIIAGPTDLVRHTVMDEEGVTLWSVEAEEPQTLEYIFYGIVPEGFRQVEPQDDFLPRPLIPGEVLFSETESLEFIFTHEGVASENSGWVIIEYDHERIRSDDED